MQNKTLDVPFPVCIDFETYGIEARPDYPPKPVGVSIKYFNEEPRYYGFGHPKGNNSTFEEAKSALISAFGYHQGILCQNAKFDIDVAETHFGIPPPKWEKIHDTMYLIYLYDPNQEDIGLKASCERILGVPPTDQLAIYNWLVGNFKEVKVSPAKQSSSFFGKYIAYAPADLVGAYCNSDVSMTEELFQHLYVKIVEMGMLKAYDRERELMPVLLSMERQGIKVDRDLLKSDIDSMTQDIKKIEAYIYEKIGGEINLKSSRKLLEKLLESGLVDLEKCLKTKTGAVSASKGSLKQGLNDTALLLALEYFQALKTCLNTFTLPWFNMSEKTGKIYTTWNQTKVVSPDGKGIGTRTGRLSSNPNIQNVPKALDLEKFDFLIKLLDLSPPPKVRSYIVPFDGHVLIDRDYSQQEPRILAHYDAGKILDQYLKNPWIDFHDSAKAELEKAGKFFDRKKVKGVNLGLLYGMGIKKLAFMNGMTEDEARDLKTSILSLYDGIKALFDEMRTRARNNKPIRTFGGRVYYCPPDKEINGEMVSFDYKMVNTLIQGSAADCTKEALIRFARIKEESWKIILNVHDEIVVSVPANSVTLAMEVLRKAMESIEFDVSMKSEGAISYKNWGELVDYDKKGVILGKIEGFSATKLLKYEQCPLSAKYQYVDKISDPTLPISPALIKGREVHASIEGFIRGEYNSTDTLEEVQKRGAEIENRYNTFTLNSMYFVKSLEKIKDIRNINLTKAGDSEVILEQTWYFDKDFKETADKEAKFYHFVLDCLILKGDMAIIIDWKTGKVSPFSKEKYLSQLEMYAIAVFMKFPRIKTIKAVLEFVEHGVSFPEGGKYYYRKGLDNILTPLKRRIEIMGKDTKFSASPTPLCGFCEYNAKSGRGLCRY